jgi:hypothetical protein
MEFFNRFNPKELIAIIAILSVVVVVLVAIIAGVWYASSRNRHDASLRREMLDRGMSAAEIEQAMRGFAGPLIGSTTTHQVRWYDAEIGKSLASSGVLYSPQTIEYVMSAFRNVPDAEKQAVYNAIEGMISEEATEDRLLAAVRSLCRPGDLGSRPEFDSRAPGQHFVEKSGVA